MKDTILLVDDSNETIMMIERKLTEYDIVSVKSGREMRERIDQVRPSLILLDVVIPDEDGFEIARHLSSIDKYSHIPIVFITAKTEGKDVETGFDSGGYDYIKKPFDPVEMRARIKSAIRKKNQVADLKALTYTDYLTGGYTRRYFIDVLSKELEKKKRKAEKDLSVAMMDLDLFKLINDSYGHQAGDYVLIQFVEALKKVIRPYDVLARYGGEEFVLMLTECDKLSAMEILMRVRSMLENSPIVYRGKGIALTFSSGIADLNDFADDGTAAEGIIGVADGRLYEAKQNGRNQIVVK